MTQTQTHRPEIGKSVVANGIRTNYLAAGAGTPVVIFIHGSGPGVTAYANWRLLFPALGSDIAPLADKFRLIAPDLVGFGFTDRPGSVEYNLQTWADQVLGLMDALDIPSATLVGNSFGGAIALRIATQHAERVERLVLMGSMGVSFPITDGLDWVWGYQPSFENMRKCLDYFAWSRDLVSDELAEVRYQASIQPGFQESFGSMFPAPRQRSVEAMAIPEPELRALKHQTLLIHGREDQVIPLDASLRLLQLIDNAELHVWGHCGHWTQIERQHEFTHQLLGFIPGKK
jgi:pimeloyl-ACP methyl ester carboxylesterase